mgnify:CR=1 FL=1
MFIGKIEGLRLLKNGSASVMLTCSGADLQAIANLRQGMLTCYGESEKPATENKVTMLAQMLETLREIADQVSKDLGAECNKELQLTMEVGDD